MIKHFLSVAILGALSAPLVFAQADAGRILGIVTDASGAVIPAAPITVLNEKTGQSRKLTSNEQGHYLVTPLQPSTYSLTVEVPGMAKAEYTSISLQVGQE